MLGKGHAASGAAFWLAGWSWTAVAGLAHPRADVLTVGTLVCAGAALAPDFDHRESRIANSAGKLTWCIAVAIGILGKHVHAITKLDADRPDEDGHRTITHTLVFALLAGWWVSALSGQSDELGAWMEFKSGMPLAPLGKLLAAAIVYIFVRLGFAAARSALPGRQRRTKLAGVRWRQATLVAGAAAIYSYAMVPAEVWWLGLAVTVGCVVHLAGDVITASGCPVLWPVPIPSTVQRYDRKQRAKVPVRVWRTWYLVGTPRWMRFRVGSPTEVKVTWGIVALGALAVAGLVYAGGWGPTAVGG